MGTQARFDIAQALAIGELSKGHDHVLIETTEPFGVALALVARDASAKGMQRQVIHQLRENEFARIHDPSPRKPGDEHQVRRRDGSSR
jgi:hypothetical protein